MVFPLPLLPFLADDSVTASAPLYLHTAVGDVLVSHTMTASEVVIADLLNACGGREPFHKLLGYSGQ